MSSGKLNTGSGSAGDDYFHDASDHSYRSIEVDSHYNKGHQHDKDCHDKDRHHEEDRSHRRPHRPFSPGPFPPRPTPPGPNPPGPFPPGPNPPGPFPPGPIPPGPNPPFPPGCGQVAQLQNAIQGCCGLTGLTGNSLCKAIAAGELFSQPPYSCMTELITKYCDQHQPITDAQKHAAFEAFSDTTGYKPMDLTRITENLANQGTNLANFNSFYMFMPMIILLLLFIWLMVGFRRINWAVGLFATVFVIVILYSFSIAYRLNVQTYVRNRHSNLNAEIHQAQENFQNSIAYWNQGLFSAACAVTCTGTSGSPTGCWMCHRASTPETTPDLVDIDGMNVEVINPNVPNTNILNVEGGVGVINANIPDAEVPEAAIDEEPVRRIRKRKGHKFE